MANPITWIMILLVFGTAFNGYSWKIAVAIAGFFTAVYLAIIAQHGEINALQVGLVFTVLTLISLAVHAITRLLYRYTVWRDERISSMRARQR
jgi:hypothetical protein